MPATEALAGPTRHTPRALLAVAALLLAARISLGVWDATSPDARPDLVNWSTPAAVARAADRPGRLALYAFTDPSQAQSRSLAHDVFSSPSIASSINQDFLSVRIDGPLAQDRPEAAALRRRFRITELPSLVVESPDGARWKVMSGYQGERAVRAFLHRARVEVLGLPADRGGEFRLEIGGPREGAASGGVEGDSVSRR